MRGPRRRTSYRSGHRCGIRWRRFRHRLCHPLGSIGCDDPDQCRLRFGGGLASFGAPGLDTPGQGAGRSRGRDGAHQPPGCREPGQVRRRIGSPGGIRHGGHTTDLPDCSRLVGRVARPSDRAGRRCGSDCTATGFGFTRPAGHGVAGARDAPRTGASGERAGRGRSRDGRGCLVTARVRPADSAGIPDHLDGAGRRAPPVRSERGRRTPRGDGLDRTGRVGDGGAVRGRSGGVPTAGHRQHHPRCSDRLQRRGHRNGESHRPQRQQVDL